MERLLHYVWKHKILPLKPLATEDGQEVEVIDPGLHNHDQGPDFFNAKIRLGGTLWAGNVEVHLRSSDWYRHSHQEDPAYNSVILHVVGEIDGEVRTQDGKTLPQLQLDIPEGIRRSYEELCRTEDYPRCHRIVTSILPMKVHQWMDALLVERLKERSEKVAERAERTGGDWERATFVTLARSFGFGLNGDAFERWAMRIPLSAAGKHRDDLFQVEALFLGMAGLIEEVEAVRSAKEVQLLQQEYAFLRHKFGLDEPMQRADWRFLRTRPKNFPSVRILQIAELYHSGRAQMSKLLEARDIDALQECLAVKGMTAASRRLLIINTVVPLLFAYGRHISDEDICQRACLLLEALPAENNYILRQWQACGLKVQTAADSQALIQLKRQYCDRTDCLRCRFGYEYLKGSSSFPRVGNAN
ncbi:MAG: DUF2851 family protein [Bacteroidaceae bacterium]|nr:DUF2851 family protein [Bacteroidaceae bacterium]